MQSVILDIDVSISDVSGPSFRRIRENTTQVEVSVIEAAELWEWAVSNPQKVMEMISEHRNAEKMAAARRSQSGPVNPAARKPAARKKAPAKKPARKKPAAG